MEGKIKIYSGTDGIKEKLLAEIPIDTSKMLMMESITNDSSADVHGEVKWAHLFNHKEESRHSYNSETNEWTMDYYHKFTIWERIKRYLF